MYTILQEFRFYLTNEGLWLDAYGNLLADVLAKYEIIVDDRTQFALLYDYERMIKFEYRAFPDGKITLLLNRIERRYEVRPIH